MKSNLTGTFFACSTLLLASIAGCKNVGTHTGDTSSDTSSDDTSPPDAPTVQSTDPPAGAIDAALNQAASVTFSVPMDPASMTEATFTLATAAAPSVPVDGAVLYADAGATFWPAAHLASNTSYNATITTGARSADGVALAEDYAWTFTTGETVAPGLPVDLGLAGGFAILAKSGISSVPASVITGDIGVSPAAATYITGFSLSVDASNTFATSAQVIGRVYAADYAQPTPTTLTIAVADMERAFTDAAARAPDATELGAGNIGGMTLAPGVYKWGTGLLVPADVTLAGSPTDVWIFQVAQALTVSNGTSVVLSGGADASNVFWQVGGLVDVGTTAHVEGVVLTLTSARMGTGASIRGRLLAQTAVDLEGAVVTAP